MVTGNEFYIDLRLKTDFKHAAVTDELDDTISYADIYAILKQVMEIPSKLLEHVCVVYRDFIERGKECLPDILFSCMK